MANDKRDQTLRIKDNVVLIQSLLKSKLQIFRHLFLTNIINWKSYFSNM